MAKRGRCADGGVLTPHEPCHSLVLPSAVEPGNIAAFSARAILIRPHAAGRESFGALRLPVVPYPFSPLHSSPTALSEPCLFLVLPSAAALGNIAAISERAILIRPRAAGTGWRSRAEDKRQEEEIREGGVSRRSIRLTSFVRGSQRALSLPGPAQRSCTRKHSSN
eukprot:4500347-Pyramimonas_sp.AAC.1